MQEILKVGNVIFAEEGVMVVRPYITDEVRITDKVITYDMIRPHLLALCVRRMRHCAKMLETNLASATQVNSEFVVWKDGHFSLSVYKALQHFVGSNGVKGEFSAFVRFSVPVVFIVEISRMQNSMKTSVTLRLILKKSLRL